MTISCLVAGVIARDSSLSACVLRNNRNRFAVGASPASAGTSAFCEARERLDPELVASCARQLAISTLESSKPQPMWKGFHPFVVDGTTLTTDDTEANQADFPQHGKQDEGLGFPIMRCVFLSCLSTGMVHAFNHGPFKGKETGEMALARELFPSLPDTALLMGDCYFPSFFVLAMLLSRGLQGLFPMHFARDIDFRRGKSLGPKDHLVYWEKPQKPAWMSWEEFDSYPEQILLREVDITRETGHGKPFVVVTTLLDPIEFSKSKLANMYKKRWKIEVMLRDFKSTFQLESVKAKTPRTTLLLIWIHVLAYNILMWHMMNAAKLANIPAENISVTNAARIIENYGALIAIAKREIVPIILTQMYLEMVSSKLHIRENRKEPRAVKKRPKPQARLKEKRSAWKERLSA